MSESNSKPAAAPVFEIYAAHPSYAGIHPSKVRFEAGIGRTASEKQAQHCRDAGLAVFDLSDPKDVARLKSWLKANNRQGPAQPVMAAAAEDEEDEGDAKKK